MEKLSEDNVNHPKHYNIGDMEVIDIIKEISKYIENPFDMALITNIIKYICRYQHKENELQDIKKGQWYFNRLVKEVEERNTP